MTTVAFIGLGIMGGPMAGHLVEAGYDVVGYNLQPAAGRDAGRAGGRGAELVAEAVRRPTSSPRWCRTPPTCEEVLAGEDGVFAQRQAGALVIDFSRSAPMSPPARRGRPKAGLAAARRPGVRRRGGRDRGQPVDHGRRRRPADFEARARC